MTTQEKRRASWRKWYHNNKDAARQARKNTSKRLWEWYIEYKKKQTCKSCGFDDYRALQFHHRDPSTKVGNVSDMASRGIRNKLITELAKCDCYCANCHLILECKIRSGGMV